MAGITLDEMLGIYDEDSAHSSGDPGMLGLAVRRDADTSLVDTDGDYAPLQVNATGALKIAGSFSAGNEYDEDTAHTTGDAGGFILAIRNDTLGSLVDTDGDYGGLQLSALGALYTEPRQATHDNHNVNANLQVGDADHAVGNPLFVTGTVADDAADSGNPIKVGGRALDGLLSPVADNDRFNLAGDFIQTFIRQQCL